MEDVARRSDGDSEGICFGSITKQEVFGQGKRRRALNPTQVQVSLVFVCSWAA